MLPPERKVSDPPFRPPLIAGLASPLKPVKVMLPLASIPTFCAANAPGEKLRFPAENVVNELMVPTPDTDEPPESLYVIGPAAQFGANAPGLPPGGQPTGK